MEKPQEQDKTIGFDYSPNVIWSVYVREAESYDLQMVEGWKDDMEGTLIFAGLFSATVTAFIIESYKNLQPDSGDLTVAALTHISLQLAASNQSDTLPPFQAGPFATPNHAVRSTVLFFLSLAFSLGCALAAILVKQWAQNYLHATQRRPSPRLRAKIRSYLDEGVKRFQLQSLVEAIPTLLHISLFLFFGGLLEFFLPINPVLAYLDLAILVIGAGLYLTAALTGTLFRSCPYQSTLSSIFWYIMKGTLPARWKILQTAFLAKNPADSVELIATGGTDKENREPMFESLFANSRIRDENALRWTLEALTDNDELEPFVSGIPGFIASDNAGNNYDIMRRFQEDDALQLDERIVGLLASSAYLPPTQQERRVTIALTAMWSLLSASIKCNMKPVITEKHRFDYLPEYINNGNSSIARLASQKTLLLVAAYFQWVSPHDSKHRQNSLGRLLISVQAQSGLIKHIPLDQILDYQLGWNPFPVNVRIACITMLLATHLKDPLSPGRALSLSLKEFTAGDIYSRVTNDLMCTADPRLQQSFAQVMGDMSRKLDDEVHNVWSPKAMNALLPLLATVDDPGAIQDAIQLMETLRGNSSYRWTSLESSWETLQRRHKLLLTQSTSTDPSASLLNTTDILGANSGIELQPENSKVQGSNTTSAIEPEAFVEGQHRDERNKYGIEALVGAAAALQPSVSESGVSTSRTSNSLYDPELGYSRQSDEQPVNATGRRGSRETSDAAERGEHASSSALVDPTHNQYLTTRARDG